MTTNEIKCEPEQKQGGKAAAELLPNKSHARANVSLLQELVSKSYKLRL